MSYLTVLLNSKHERNRFSCENAILNNYFYYQVNQDIKRKLSVCFVLQETDTIVKGYYTLSNDNIPFENLPAELSKKLPKGYGKIPASLIGRLAVDSSFKGKGNGEILLLDALKRCLDVAETTLGSMAVVVDPIDEIAVSFYKKYGFILLPDSDRMFLPMKTISLLFE